jgi:hypothetical protein
VTALSSSAPGAGSGPDPRDVLDLDWQAEAFAVGSYVRVVNWHNTPRSQRHLLRAELAWYAERYTPVTPSDLDRFTDTGEWGLSRPGFVPAFYDSYRSHAEVAAPVLDELGLTGWFFTLTGPLDLPADEQRPYAATHDVDLIPEESDPPLWLGWDDLERIARRHVLVAHTAHHATVESVRTAEDVAREITEPVRLLTDLTGSTPPAFAFLFGAVPEPGTPAGEALRAEGIRWAVTNTAYVRIGD